MPVEDEMSDDFDVLIEEDQEDDFEEEEGDDVEL